VIATPVPSYLPVIQHGANGFLAATPEDWLRYLDDLRDPDLRRMVGERARQSVLDRFSQETQAKNLLAVLDRLTLGSPTREPAVRIHEDPTS